MSNPDRLLRHRLTLLCTIGFLVGTTACSRAVSVQTPTPVYAISVENATPEELIVSYDDGTASRALGTVLPGRIERFIIAATADNPIAVTARSASGSLMFGPYTVRLLPGETVPLIIR